MQAKVNVRLGSINSYDTQTVVSGEEKETITRINEDIETTVNLSPKYNTAKTGTTFVQLQSASG